MLAGGSTGLWVAMFVALSGPGTTMAGGFAIAEAPAAEDPSASAKAAHKRGRKAASAGDYQAAIEAFETALQLQPAAKLHFNIAVCHHRLLGQQSADSHAYEQHRAAAITSYNRYLEAAAPATDYDDVAAIVHALGGTPWAPDQKPWTIELVEPDDVPAPPPFDGWDEPSQDPVEPDVDDGDSETTPTHPPETPPETPPRQGPPPPPPHRGEIGGYMPLTLLHPVALADSAELSTAPALGLGVRGFGLVGPRRRVVVGAEGALSAQLTSATARHRYNLGHLTALFGYRHPVVRDRFELGVDGTMGLGIEGLVFDGEGGLRCSEGRVASRRTGLWSGVRLVATVLLGRRRNHAVSARVGPGLSAFGSGSLPNEDADGNDCSTEPTAFERFALPDGASLVMTFDLGYAARL